MAKYLQLNNKKYFIIIVVGLLIAVFSLVFLKQDNKDKQTDTSFNYEISQLKTKSIFYKEKEFKTYIADTDSSRELGLSVFNALLDNEAMLFVFERSKIYPFWMKGMKFPIDILWLDEHKNIVSIKENARPEDFPETYSPRQKALYVLEFKSGFVEKEKITLGDEFIWE